MLPELTRIRDRRSGRVSSWDRTGRNRDYWTLEPGEARVLAEIAGPAQITHLWMTQGQHYRECVLRFYWDNSSKPSVQVPLGDFFCLGNGIVNSFQSALFTASTRHPYQFNQGCALNCYAPMPFRERCVVELVNESAQRHCQYFYIDYETLEAEDVSGDFGYFHAEFRRANPFGGWGPEIRVNTPEADIANREQLAWDNNYVILETAGRGHYIGCNMSVSNFQGTWWGEGDDMIWVDGYKWPPDLHGTGSEDYFNQAWGMQDNAFMHNGSSVYEAHTLTGAGRMEGGYQTSYVFHLENPVRFQKQVKVTIEIGHGNHLANDVASVAYWYADQPTPAAAVPSVAQRMPVRLDTQGQWIIESTNQCPGSAISHNNEMQKMKKAWAQRSS